MSAPTFKEGLEDVVAGTSSICFLDGIAGRLLYYGYDVHDLATNSSFEEVAYLLWHGELPTDVQLSQLRAVEHSYRHLPADVRAAIELVPLDAHPMDEVRTAVSLIGARDLAGTGSVLDVSGTVEENVARSIRSSQAGTPWLLTSSMSARCGSMCAYITRLPSGPSPSSSRRESATTSSSPSGNSRRSSGRCVSA